MSPLGKAGDIFTMNLPKQMLFMNTINTSLHQMNAWPCIKASGHLWPPVSFHLQSNWEVTLTSQSQNSLLKEQPQLPLCQIHPYFYIYSDMRETPWCPANINGTYNLKGCSLHGWSFGRLIHDQERGYHLCISITSTSKWLSSSVATLWLACKVGNVRMAWPLSMKLDFWVSCVHCFIQRLHLWRSEVGYLN